MTSVTFIDNETRERWHYEYDADEPIPRIGEEVYLFAAPKGVLHRVVRVQHRIGAEVREPTVFLDRLMTDYKTRNDL